MHPKTSVRLIVLLSILSVVGCSSSREPQNLYFIKRAIDEYYADTTLYLADVKKICTEAKSYIQKNLDPSKKNAVIFDVDETLLLNTEYILDYDYGWTRESWDAWIDSAKAFAVQPMLDLYNWIKAKGITIFVITGRYPSVTISNPDPTERNLLKVGYTGFEKLYLKPRTPKITTSEYKLQIRKQITENGYTIVANFGDQESDFKGGYNGKPFKIPNPMYFTQ
jgi:acid phosphatase